MKKLLGLLGTIGLVVTPMTSLVVSCNRFQTPIFDKDGDSFQFSDAWNTKGLKKVSVYSGGGADDVKIQLINLMLGRMKNVSASTANDLFSKITFTFYKSSSTDSKILDKDKDIKGYVGKQLYFSVKYGTNDESNLMNFYVSDYPSAIHFTTVLDDKTNNNYTMRIIAKNFSSYKDSTQEELAILASDMADQLAKHSTIKLKDKSGNDIQVAFDDYFLPSYELGKFGKITNAESNVLRLIESDPKFISDVAKYDGSGNTINLRSYVVQPYLG